MAQAKSNQLMKRARQHIAEQMKQIEDARRYKQMQQRLELVSLGLKELENKRVIPAAQHFLEFLQLLEQSKNLKPGELTPERFDASKEMGDTLLLASVYWELAKIYDQMRSENGTRLFKEYLSKYLLFAKDSTFKTLCAEAVRRYLSNGHPKHSPDFRAAYDALGGRGCFVVTSLLDVTDPETLPTLRAFRDTQLADSFLGRVFIARYYAWGPSLAKGMDRMPQRFRRLSGWLVDRFARLISR
jgi:hypothetical protein